MAVLETVRKAICEGEIDFLREGVRVLGLDLAPGNDEGSGLAGIPPLARRARPCGGPVHHQGRPPGPREGRPRAPPRRQSARAAEQEIKRRTEVDGILPTRASLIRLVVMVLFEYGDE